jgi:hypothetical protein
MFAIPIAAFFGAIVPNGSVFSSCADQRATIDSVDGAPFIGAAGSFVGKQMERVASWIPGVADDASCDWVILEDIIVIGGLALIMYAMMELYTNFLWSNLGRRVRPIVNAPDNPDALDETAGEPLLYVPILSGLAVWVPTLVPPFLLFAFNIGSSWWLLLGANTLLAAIEIIWFELCLRGIANPKKFPETTIFSI